ncbi:hypothetical protein [Prescottella subtropica]|uniref:hypothetical protein n=1 Tax=Prescottella subtropica TaxID=2545757 RepID=UPI0010F90516|nr:hypothetical protein [Prescottella subtropica]
MAALVGAVSLVVVSCGSDQDTQSAAPQPEAAASSTTTQPTPEAKTSPCGKDAGSALPATDGSVEAALAKANVTDEMVCGLGDVMDETGYGFDNRATTFQERQGFASIELDNCRETANGYTTWDEVINEDVAQGAPRRASTTLNGYLRDVYCPAMLDQPEEAPPATAMTSGPVDGNGMRGIYSKLAWYDGKFEGLPPSECTSRLGEFMLGEGRAYRFDDSTILCVDVPSASRGGEDAYIWLATLAFTTPHDEESALGKALQLVPDGPQMDSRMIGTNTQGPNSCLSVDYRSQQLEKQAPIAAPNKTTDRGFVNVRLYSGRQTSQGSSSPYTGNANAAYVSTSRDNDGGDPAC